MSDLHSPAEDVSAQQWHDWKEEEIAEWRRHCDWWKENSDVLNEVLGYATFQTYEDINGRTHWYFVELIIIGACVVWLAGKDMGNTWELFDGNLCNPEWPHDPLRFYLNEVREHMQ